MKTLGIIVEYNPFHYGHALHIEKAKEKYDADVVIAVMSGNFLQRGEPALVSKWARTSMALAAGVDIVIELPYPFATQKADMFAKGAVTILTALGCDALCFGSESGNIDDFHQTYTFYQQNETHIQQEIKQQMKAGNSYPKAVATAYQSCSPHNPFLDLSKPNNMLGYQYVAAVQQQKRPLHVFTINRQHAHYHDEHFSSETIASATSIRKALLDSGGDVATIKQYIPQATYDVLNKYKQQYNQFHQWENYWPLLQYQLLQTDEKHLHNIYEMEEGLENRFLASAHNATSFQHFMELMKTKRYTWTRLQRAAVHVLTNTTKTDMSFHGEQIEYLRLLGFSTNGRLYLNKVKHHLPVPLISKLSAFPTEKIILDIRASKIYALGLSTTFRVKQWKAEYSQPPLYNDKKIR